VVQKLKEFFFQAQTDEEMTTRGSLVMLTRRRTQKRERTAIKISLALRLSFRLILYYLNPALRVDFIECCKEVMNELCVRTRDGEMVHARLEMTILVPYLYEALCNFREQVVAMPNALLCSEYHEAFLTYCSAFLGEVDRFHLYLQEQVAHIQAGNAMDAVDMLCRHFVAYLIAYHQMEKDTHGNQLSKMLQLCILYPRHQDEVILAAYTPAWTKMEQDLEEDIEKEQRKRIRNFSRFAKSKPDTDIPNFLSEITLSPRSTLKKKDKIRSI